MIISLTSTCCSRRHMFRWVSRLSLSKHALILEVNCYDAVYTPKVACGTRKNIALQQNIPDMQLLFDIAMYFLQQLDMCTISFLEKCPPVIVLLDATRERQINKDL